jgi:ABC-type antimicrobial peptide transport system permease subunit
VVVINETLARLFGKRDPLGQRLKAGGAWRTVVGIVSDVKSGSLEMGIRPQLYLPHAQWAWAGMTVVLQTDRNPLSCVSSAKQALKKLDPSIPAANIRTMDQVLARVSSARRFHTALLTFFAASALLLTVIGIYGVVAFLVGRRSHEIGIRMALGAHPGQIVRLVLRRGMRPVLFGAGAGLAGSLAASRLLRSQLYGVSSSDPLTLGFIIALLFCTAMIACWLPARRASCVDPMDALRSD